MERPPLRYLKPTPGKTFRTLNEAEIEATVKNKCNEANVTKPHHETNVTK